MPFKDTGAGQTHYLDEDGKLVGEISPEELAKWKALPMYAPLPNKLMTIEEIKAELGKEKDIFDATYELESIKKESVS